MFDDELIRIVGDHLGIPVTFVSRPTPISGGFWASIHGFEITGGPDGWNRPLVLRVMPDRAAGVRETVVQRTVAEQGFPTPPVLASGVDGALGGAYIVMPRAAGSSPMPRLDLGRSLLHLPSALRSLTGQLADVVVRLHALDPAPVAAALSELDPDEVPGGGHGLERRLRSIRAVGDLDIAGASTFVELADWLDAHRPGVMTAPGVADAMVVSHGDIHPFNLLIDDAGAVTVLDWTNANLLPREFDVGFTAGLLRCAPISVPRLARPLLRRLTGWLAEAFVEQYAAAAPLDHTAVAWFEALQYGRCLAELAVSRAGSGASIGTDHPFETSAAAMVRRLHTLTTVAIILPPRPAPAS